MNTENRIWRFRLYISGHSAQSLTAIANLKKICEMHLPGQYSLEIIDVFEHPEEAKKDRIIAIPTLIRKLPEPIRKVIGDLSEEEKVVLNIELV